MENYTITYEKEFDERLKVPFKRLSKWNLPFVFNIEVTDDIKNIPHELYDYKNLNNERVRYILPIDNNNIYIYKANENCIKYHGVTLGNKIGVCIFENDTIDFIELRIVHEILHSMKLKSDDLEKYTKDFMDIITLALYNILKSFKMNPNHIPYFQRKYYKWLLKYEE